MPATAHTLGTGLPASLRALLDGVQARRTRTAADRSLARRVSAAVRAAGVAPSGVAVYVHDGAVSLFGTVRDRAARDAWVAATAAVPGVRRIVDSLRLAATDAA